MRNYYIIILFCAWSLNIAAQKKPNIIFFFTDDQAYNTLGVYGNDQVKTPHIDQLGENGVIFDRHYNTTAICMASRANLMTGMYEYKTGCNFLHGPLGKKQWSTSYPMLLKEAGYKIGFAGKFGFAVSDKKNMELKGAEGSYSKQFFDDWKGSKGQTDYETAKNRSMSDYAEKYPHSTRSYGAATVDFIKSASKGKTPFCMSVYFKAPHFPLTPDPYFDDIYKNTTWKKAPNYGPENAKHLTEHSRTGRQIKYFNDLLNTDGKYQDYMRKYHQLLYGVDYAVGMVLEALKDLKIDDNTIIIFSSDNGSYLGSHGLGGKVLPYEEGARVPLIIYDPRTPKTLKRRSESLTGNVDITATILDIAGIDTPKNYDGISLLPIVQGKTKSIRETLPIIQVWGPESTRCFSVLTKDFKYVYWFYNDAKKGLIPTEELFDIKNDPLELKNLANTTQYKRVLEDMRHKYDQQVIVWQKESVAYNGYAEYAQLFDRELNWDQKEKLIQEKNAKSGIKNKKNKPGGKKKKKKSKKIKS